VTHSRSAATISKTGPDAADHSPHPGHLPSIATME
jgi:hypothetical protein